MEQAEEKTQRHKDRMQRKKEVIGARVAKATEERGVVILLKGTGKGKSSSAFGTVTRALGHEQRVGVVQYIKGKWQSGEQMFLQSTPLLEHYVMGEGFTWETQDKSLDIIAAEKAWQKSTEMLQDDSINLVLLDEFTYMFKYQYLELEPCLAVIKARPKNQNVIITGRTAPVELEEIADTVSEVRNIKHAFSAGVKAQKGIEW